MSATKTIFKSILIAVICVIAIIVGAFYAHKSITTLLEEKQVVQKIEDRIDEQLDKIIYEEEQSTNNTEQHDELYESSYETLEMNEEQCFPEEQFDVIEQICFYECSTDEECAQIEAKIQARLDAIEESYLDEAGETFQEIEPEENPPIASYDISGDTIQLQSGEDQQQYHEIWNYFTMIIPQEVRSNLLRFEIFSDGIEGTLAAVNQHEQEPTKWVIAIDPEDAYGNGSIKKNELTYSLIHEVGHLITLNAQQVPPDTKLYSARTQEAYDQLLKKGKTLCEPRYYPGEGCSNENSYINLFVQTFWNENMAEFEQIDSIEDEEARVAAIDQFYVQHFDQFMTPYSSSGPNEDIAESFTSFVLSEKPKGNTLAEQKVLFFYQFNEFLTLRESIRSKIR